MVYIKYQINPTTNISSSIIINIMVNLVDQIDKAINLNKNIIIEKNYNNTLKIIFNITMKYLRIYNFYSHNITNIFVQIYNINIGFVINYQFTYVNGNLINTSNSNWLDFYNNNGNLETVVYNSMTSTQQDNLRLAISNGDYFMVDNIPIVQSNINYLGILLKNNYSNNCSNNCCDYTINNINNINNNKDVLITTIFYEVPS